MAIFSIPKIKVQGISAGVPANRKDNLDLDIIPDKEKEVFVNTTGIRFRRVVPGNLSTLDISIPVIKKLIRETGWKNDEIGIIVFVTQTPDHLVPGPATQVQDIFGIPKSCVCIDVNQGCAGYVYGLAVIAGFMSTARIKKGLLVVSDTISKYLSPEDKSTYPVFSDASSCTALEVDPLAGKILFNLGSDGGGFKTIHIPHGGSRSPFDEGSLIGASFGPGKTRNKTHLFMEGLDVLQFALREIKPNVNDLLKTFELSESQVDFYVFHQANKLLNTLIQKQLKIPDNKILNSIELYGNTSCATIPVTLCSSKDKIETIVKRKALLCGFGVGLSWGSCHVDLNDTYISEVIEIN